MVCDDPSCGQLTRDVPSFPQRGPAVCSCNRGHLHPEVRGEGWCAIYLFINFHSFSTWNWGGSQLIAL